MSLRELNLKQIQSGQINKKPSVNEENNNESSYIEQRNDDKRYTTKMIA